MKNFSWIFPPDDIKVMNSLTTMNTAVNKTDLNINF